MFSQIVSTHMKKIFEFKLVVILIEFILSYPDSIWISFTRIGGMTTLIFSLRLLLMIYNQKKLENMITPVRYEDIILNQKKIKELGLHTKASREEIELLKYNQDKYLLKYQPRETITQTDVLTNLFFEKECKSLAKDI